MFSGADFTADDINKHIVAYLGWFVFSIRSIHDYVFFTFQDPIYRAQANIVNAFSPFSDFEQDASIQNYIHLSGVRISFQIEVLSLRLSTDLTIH
jgi:hypothetical protein